MSSRARMANSGSGRTSQLWRKSPLGNSGCSAQSYNSPTTLMLQNDAVNFDRVNGERKRVVDRTTLLVLGKAPAAREGQAEFAAVDEDFGDLCVDDVIEGWDQVKGHASSMRRFVSVVN